MTMPNHTMADQDRLSTADFAAAADRRPRVEETPAPSPAFEPAPSPTVEQATGATADNRAPLRDRRAPLFAGNDAEGFRTRWTGIQAGFVDEPRTAVEQADGLVAEVMQRLAQVFADERSSLERRWDRGADANTEELRQALQHYRSFFDRLLAL